MNRVCKMVWYGKILFDKYTKEYDELMSFSIINNLY